MTSGTTPPTPAPPTKGERTQARILDAAINRFGTNGFRPTSVAAIARDAGVSAAAPFAYWPSKEALFDAAVDADARAVIIELLGTVDVRHDDLVMWLALVNQLLAVLERHPLARRVLAGQEPESIDRLLKLSAFDDLRSLLAAVIRQGQDEGTVRTDLDPERAAIGIESITIAMAMAVLQLRDGADPIRESGVAEVLLAAFRPPPA